MNHVNRAPRGENRFVDQCTSKYWQSVSIVGQMSGAANQDPSQQAAAQAQQQQQKKLLVQ